MARLLRPDKSGLATTARGLAMTERKLTMTKRNAMPGLFSPA